MKFASDLDEYSIRNSINKVIYHIIDPSGRSGLEIQNLVYDSWKVLWRGVFDQVGRGEDLDPDDFFKQNLITALTMENEVVGFNLSTFYDLNRHVSSEHSYFGDIDKDLMSELRASGLQRLMSIEYLSVNPKWRRSLTGISFSDVLMSLGTTLLPYLSCDAVIGTARVDVKVDAASVRLGFKPYQVIKKYDYECRVVVCTEQSAKPHSDPLTRQLINSLWATRNDLSRLTYIKPEQTQIAG